MLALRATFSIAIFLSIIYKTECIQCYYCTSANNTACLDVNMYEPELRPRIIPIIECDRAIPSSVAVNFFCRKIIQTVFHPHRDSEVRVTRGCGWVPHERECYKDDNSDHLGTYCQCFDDLCNSGDTVDPTVATVLFLVFAAVTYLWSGI
ncbi:uncharacterized protein LOC112048343 [Bicyclus anynana]|uniref:Uncharacterized protein LOC112048343 n=1 Tax=Bicyclus anynana TaxID=110368 RepID=A0ABM3LZZ7_BICAN|nr:uncharacterized protein LOC112048343 [Bicyclus anynana]